MTVRRRRRDKRIWYVLIVVFVAVGFFSFLTQREDGAEVEAASLEKFDAGYIISDYQMRNYKSMTEKQIQEFLTKKNGCKNTDAKLYNELSERYNTIHWHFKNGHFVCLSEEKFGDGVKYGNDLKDGKGETAAHIIWQAAQDYKINPQVLMVLLEKEQGLITDPYPHSGQYRSATGYGCPDTAPCDEKYYGFKNQVRKAAEMFNTVLNGGWTNYPLGKNYIQYNPSASCGGSIVNVKNLATSALYRYTPYQPNAAALAAGYGTAECGAYGNRNFYLYFQDWFGGIVDEGVEEEVSDTAKGDTSRTKEEGTDATVRRNNSEYSGTYTIVSALDDNKVLDVAGGAEGAKDKTNIQLWERNGTKAQEWELVDNEDGTYTLINPYTKKALDVAGASKNNGANVQLLAEDTSVCGQKWIIKKEGEDYWFTSACSDKVLDVKNAGTVNGTNIQLWEVNGNTAQKWKLEEVVKPGNVYTIVSALNDNKVLDVAGGAEEAKSGTNIQLWERNGTKAQEWELVDNEDGTYTLINPYTKKALDVSCAGTTDGTNIQLWETHETCAQRWKIKVEGKYHILTSACSDKVLDVKNAGTVNGTNIQLWQPNGTGAQKWKLIKK